jgi:anti-sigma regulatory factor (Ser/Thr protein kinase)
MALAERSGFDETGCGKVAIVVTEGSTNALKHAGSGELLSRVVGDGHALGLELLFLDKGPGMADPGRCLRDGFSTAGTNGTGLGAMSRLADLFEIHSLPLHGTAVLARLWSQSGNHADIARCDPFESVHRFDVAAVHVPKPGEEVCGDGWVAVHARDRTVLAIADGLGHGPLAADASREVLRIMRDNAALGPAAMLERIHPGLRATRGAAAGIAELDLAKRKLLFAGIGNIAGTIFAEDASRSTISYNGILGHEMRKVREFDYPFPKGALLVMHSDGLATNWRLDRYAGLATRNPAIIAGVLYRDFKRGHDDITILVAREDRMKGE